MPRRQVTFAPGRYYHLYNRGANRETIFANANNYYYSIQLMQDYRKRFQITVVAYCHMPNHYHWLVRQDSETPLHLFPQRVWKAYSNAFNNTNRRSGSLFEGRYCAIAVTNDDYLRQLCRYIHANPVHHAIASTPGAWIYSNYLDWIGKRNGTMLDRTFIETMFGSADHYMAYMNAYLLEMPTFPAWLKEQLGIMGEEPRWRRRPDVDA